MTVAELIAELQKIPGHKEVWMSTEEFDDDTDPCIVETADVIYRGPDVVLERK
mgnify:CR=1 FL=1